MKRLFPVAGLILLLCACELFSPAPAEDTPSVRSVSPEPNAENVAEDVTVEALLEFGESRVDPTTLTDSSVTLEGPEGAVSATRRLSGDTLTLTPNTSLEPSTTYTFAVTEALETASGRGFEPFSSSFTTREPAALSLSLQNALGLPSESRMVLSKVNNFSGNPCDLEPVDCDPTSWQSMKFTDSGTLELENTGSESVTVSLASDEPTLFTVSPASLTIPAGETAEAEVAFVGKNLGNKAIYEALINATVGTQTVSLEVAGVYQPAPEGSRELSIGQLMGAFGYRTDLGTNGGGFLEQDEVTSPKAGAEVRSQYWRAADGSAPVVITQLAAFMPCCKESQDFFNLKLLAEGAASPIASLSYDMAYSQSVLPRSPSSELPNTLSVPTGESFSFNISGYSSLASSGFLGVRFWPLTDAEGNEVTNTYIVAQDFARGPCGSDTGDGMASNCDYNDQIYLAQNIEPVSPY